jgi:hypothetical protein
VQKYCEGRQATDDSIMRRMRDAWWITKNTHTHTHTHTYSEFVMLVPCPQQQRLGTRLNVTLYVHCPSCWTLEHHQHNKRGCVFKLFRSVALNSVFSFIKQ